jgi:hypothetical protein
MPLKPGQGTAAGAQLPAASQRFREQLLDTLASLDPKGHIGYIDEDTSNHHCPVCRGTLIVRFHGTASRADLECLGGCSEAEVLSALRRVGARAA